MHTDNRAPEERLEWNSNKWPREVDKPIRQERRDTKKEDVIE